MNDAFLVYRHDSKEIYNGKGGNLIKLDDSTHPPYHGNVRRYKEKEIKLPGTDYSWASEVTRSWPWDEHALNNKKDGDDIGKCQWPSFWLGGLYFEGNDFHGIVTQMWFRIDVEIDTTDHPFGYLSSYDSRSNPKRRFILDNNFRGYPFNSKSEITTNLNSRGEVGFGHVNNVKKHKDVLLKPGKWYLKTISLMPDGKVSQYINEDLAGTAQKFMDSNVALHRFFLHKTGISCIKPERSYKVFSSIMQVYRLKAKNNEEAEEQAQMLAITEYVRVFGNDGETNIPDTTLNCISKVNEERYRIIALVNKYHQNLLNEIG